MIDIQLVGWFSDLPHGRPDEEPLNGNTGSVAPDDAKRVADYLDHGTVVAETMGTVLADQLSEDRVEIGRFRTLTDGEYVWPSDYPYYVRKYGAVVPHALIERARNGSPRHLDDSEIDAVVDALLI